MADAFRIEIPVEVTNNTDAAGLEKLEQILTKIYSSLQRNTAAMKNMADAMNGGADKAGSAMEQVAQSAEQAASGYDQAGNAAQKSGQEQSAAAEQAEQATDQLSDSVEDVGDAYKQTGEAAKQAGQQAEPAFDKAGENVDKFTQRTQKSEGQLRQMFAQKWQLTLAAIDKVSPVIKSVYSSAKNLTAKAWRVTVKMFDMVTAPFRKLKSMIMSPIMMTLSLAGIGMGAGSFVSTFSDFVTGMSNVKALSGATEEEFKRLTSTAEELGATTKFTAAEASEGMSYLAMAGWKTNEIIAAMPGLLDLAAAGGTSLGTAADIVSDVMTAMGMAADEASRAADIFAKTATGTNTTIENLGETLKYAAPIAHSFGLELSEVSTITGMMANAGVKGSMAGTAIRSSLLSMASPSKEAAAAMKTLNLQFADSTGKMKNLKTIVRDLSTAFAGLSEQEKLQYAEDIFGKYGSSAWLGVIDQGADAFDKLFESIDKSNGAAHEMAETQLDNLAGDVTKLQSAVDGMKISLMKDLDPYLRKGVQWLTAKIPDITAKVESFITSAIEKGKQLKDFLQGVFNSSDFQNADGFAQKFFVAWDKIIAEPFQKWWDGNGRQTILGAVEKIGKNLGELWHGIISGVFAALKGEEIDFEGMNLSGLAKAGAEAAKMFIDSFMQALNLGDLFSQAPGLLKAGLFGFGALKLGSGAVGITKTLAQIKLAFNGIPAAAASATAATTGVGAAATTAAAGTAKAVSVLGTLKAGLAAIPVWGWVAAAALAAVTIGIIAYNNAQNEQEKQFHRSVEDANQAAKQYEQSAAAVNQAAETIDKIHEIEIRIKDNRQENMNTIAQLKADIAAAGEDMKGSLQAQLDAMTADAGKIEALFEELNGLEDPVLTVTAILNKFGIEDQKDIQLIESMYNAVKTKAGVLLETLATLGISYDEFLKLTDLKKEVDTKEGHFQEELKKAGISEKDFRDLTALKSKVDTLEGHFQEELKRAGISNSDFEALTALGEQVGWKSGVFSEALWHFGISEEEFQRLTGLKGEVDTKSGLLSEWLAHFGISEQKFSELTGLAEEVQTKGGILSEWLARLGITPEQLQEATDMQDDIKTKWGILSETLLALGVDPEEFSAACVLADQVKTDSGKLTIELELQGYGFTVAGIEAVKKKMKETEALRADVRVIMSDSSLTEAQIDDYMQSLENIHSREAEIEIQLYGASLSPEEIEEYKTALEGITSRKAEIDARIAAGGLSEAEIQKLAQEYGQISDQEAWITLLLSGSSLTEQQLANISEEYNGLEDKRAEINAELNDSGIAVSELEKIAQLMTDISDNTVELNFQFVANSLQTKDLEQYNEQLTELRKNLEELTGGVFTEEGLAEGKYTEQDVQEYLQALADVDLLDLQRKVETAEANKDNAVAGRTQYEAKMNEQAEREAAASKKVVELQKLEIERQRVAKELYLMEDRFDRGEISEGDFSDYYYDTYLEGMWAVQDRYKEITGMQHAPTVDYLTTENGVISPEMWQEEEAAAKAEKEKYQALRDQRNSDLVDLYQDQKKLIEAQTFNGTSVSGHSLEELAANYSILDETGKQLYADALAALDTLNKQTDYLAESDKVQAVDIVEITAKAEVMQQVQQQVRAVSDSYTAMSAEEKTAFAASEDGKKTLEGLNAALEALNLDKIGSLDEIGKALEELAGADLSSFSLDQAQTAFLAVSGDAALAKTSVDNLLASLKAADGTTSVTTLIHNEITRRSTQTVADTNAYGGIYDGAFLSWVAEDGPEAIIPLGPDKRGRGLDLWMQAGEMLGVNEFADGGIMAPYSGMMDDIPDDVWDHLWDDDDDPDGTPRKPMPSPGGGRSGGNTVHVSVTTSPVFQIENSGSADDLIDQIKGHSKELAEILGGEIADQMVDVVLNMV